MPSGIATSGRWRPACSPTSGCGPCCRCGSSTSSARAAVIAQFDRWFGGADDFLLVDASTGQVGERRYLRWRIRLTSTWWRPEAVRLVEQHAFVTGDGLLQGIDLLCSGYQSGGAS